MTRYLWRAFRAAGILGLAVLLSPLLAGAAQDDPSMPDDASGHVAEARRPSGRPADGSGRVAQASRPSGRPADTEARKRQKQLLAYRFEQMKKDADELAALAAALQQEMGESSENILSLHLIEKAEKIEKLAKRIKNNARGY